MLGYVGGFFLGCGLGANDAGNVFGTAVGSRMVSFRSASRLAAVFVLLGALLQGTRGVETLRGLTAQSSGSAVAVVLGAGLTVALLTYLRLPASTSQAVVGAIIGVGLLRGGVDFRALTKVGLCWVTTPIGALGCYIFLDYGVRQILRRCAFSVFALDNLLRLGLVICGCYGAYALGANNVANVAAMLVDGHRLSVAGATALGGVSIALGVLFFSRSVMLTVGRGIVRMDAFSAFIAVLSQAVTVHVYAVIGVPVSSSQAIVGAVLGISLVKGVHIVRMRMLLNVLVGWLLTPLLAGSASCLLYFLAGLRYAP